MQIEAKDITYVYRNTVQMWNEDLQEDIDAFEQDPDPESWDRKPELVEIPRGLVVTRVTREYEDDGFGGRKACDLLIEAEVEMSVAKLKQIAGVFINLKGTHCQHDYDCCGHWYQSRPKWRFGVAETDPTPFWRFGDVAVAFGHRSAWVSYSLDQNV